MARFLVWYGFLGAAAAWTLQLIAGYSLEEAVCPSGNSEPWLLAVTLGTGAVAAGSLGAAFVSWRSAGPHDVVRFLAFSGMLAGIFFLVLISLGGLQLAFLDSCAQG